MITPLPHAASRRPQNALAYHHIASGVYRLPFGAVRAGEKVTLRVFAAEELAVTHAYLRIWADNAECFYPMHRCGMLWECTYTAPAAPQIVWYRFILQGAAGIRYCQPGESGIDGVDTCERNDYKSFQLTVYDPSFTVPEWASDGIMYQIFPDRFFRRLEAKIEPHNHRLHQSWTDPMEYLPDPKKGYYAADDFFGGNLAGIQEKLPYLASLGVSVLYLNPIFRAYSNHRYDTGSYEEVDPLLGSAEDLRNLCDAAAADGIRVICDGVFSHTGSDSLYFNREGTYPTIGAYQSPNSPYASWYRFQSFPDKYACWWGVWSLPEVEETDSSYMEYITGRNGIAAKWLAEGISGWRLDVADELPDEFLDSLRKRVKEKNKDALIIGEVWEDASNKVSYGTLRKFLLGSQLDTVMNYPLRELILALVSGKITAETFVEAFAVLASNYPPQAFSACMNFLSTHDVVRATTLLGKPYEVSELSREEQANVVLTVEERKQAIALHKIAALLLYSLPGMPCIYYGDEAAVEGGTDPFNRAAFPWDTRDEIAYDLTEWYRTLGNLRRTHSTLRHGNLQMRIENNLLVIERQGIQTDTSVCAVLNLTEQAADLPQMCGVPILQTDADTCETVSPHSAVLCIR